MVGAVTRAAYLESCALSFPGDPVPNQAGHVEPQNITGRKSGVEGDVVERSADAGQDISLRPHVVVEGFFVLHLDSAAQHPGCTRSATALSATRRQKYAVPFGALQQGLFGRDLKRYRRTKKSELKGAAHARSILARRSRFLFSRHRTAKTLLQDSCRLHSQFRQQRAA